MKRRDVTEYAVESIAVDLLTIVRDLLQGGKHNRHTVARQTGRSVQTADRWLKAIEKILGAKRTKVGHVSWLALEKRSLSTREIREAIRKDLERGPSLEKVRRDFDRMGGTPGGDWR